MRAILAETIRERIAELQTSTEPLTAFGVPVPRAILGLERLLARFEQAPTHPRELHHIPGTPQPAPFQALRGKWLQ
jgi:hypothetical protein